MKYLIVLQYDLIILQQKYIIMDNKILVPDISVFDMTQGQIETFALNIRQEVEAGNLDPIQVYGVSKAMEKMIDAIQDKVKDNAEMAVKALLPAGKKSIEIGNFTFTTTTRKNYVIETTSKVEKLKEEQKAIAKKLKEFSDLAKTTGIAIEHPTFGLVKPAVLKTLAPGISVKIKK